MKINGLDQIDISSTSPVPFQGSEELMKAVMTVNEVREQLGFEPITDYTDIVNNIAPQTEEKIIEEK
jgi:hypothetical protein